MINKALLNKEISSLREEVFYCDEMLGIDYEINFPEYGVKRYTNVIAIKHLKQIIKSGNINEVNDIIRKLDKKYNTIEHTMNYHIKSAINVIIMSKITNALHISYIRNDC